MVLPEEKYITGQVWVKGKQKLEIRRVENGYVHYILLTKRGHIEKTKKFEDFDKMGWKIYEY